jgi:hypothetical protein
VSLPDSSLTEREREVLAHPHDGGRPADEPRATGAGDRLHTFLRPFRHVPSCLDVVVGLEPGATRGRLRV